MSKYDPFTPPYDWQGRMIGKSVISNSFALADIVYAWDGYNIIAEKDAVSGRSTCYIWDFDLSGTMQGAGGVGGLACVVTSVMSDVPQVLVPLYGNMGNIVGYADVNGALVTHYIYDAFGKQLTMNNSELATCLTHRFSTKPYCAFTGLVHYQMRDYMPDIGRFISSDTLQELSNINLYGYCKNNSVNTVDLLGNFDLPNTWLTRFNQKYGKQINGVFLKDVLILLAAELNIWQGDDPWITSFLSLYLFGDGSKSIRLTKAEVESMSVFPGLLDLALEYDGFFETDRIISETKSKIRFEVNALGPGNLTIGHFDVFYKGTVKNCHFKGKYRLEDKFEFKWVDNWGGDVRSGWGELRLRLFTLLSSGLPFDVSSEWIDHSQ